MTNTYAPITTGTFSYTTTQYVTNTTSAASNWTTNYVPIISWANHTYSSEYRCDLLGIKYSPSRLRPYSPTKCDRIFIDMWLSRVPWLWMVCTKLWSNPENHHSFLQSIPDEDMRDIYAWIMNKVITPTHDERR